MWKSLKESFESPDSYVSLALGLAVVFVVGMIAVNYFKSLQTPGAGKDQVENSEQREKMPMKYKVVEGDTLWSIAEKFYKDGFAWTEIAKANSLTDASMLAADQELLIPAGKQSPTPTGEVSSASTEIKSEKKQYTVARGDSLWSIAVKQYNDGYKWVTIAQANHLTNPDIIHAGNVLELP